MVIVKEVIHEDCEYRVAFEVGIEEVEQVKHPDDWTTLSIPVPVFKKSVSINNLVPSEYFNPKLVELIFDKAIEELEYSDLYPIIKHEYVQQKGCINCKVDELITDNHCNCCGANQLCFYNKNLI